ncbi:hypothetical protein AGABI1DRAFT_123646 [Agaricus bisporus var. burnettii JB137-S8]|uniref:Uncharacterized protein n=1 Tax=Agaricus bisporus var. burnettii (strain JB137-S8 / ATCC MYA-4627 / FGSC 10392) TaxID=597362 RepID=K5WFT9_AGABU|nr:uncharacterized protein AGABI1DRAFT_123646 [Agaricus bisporus var. burnettii JB137-S8]EKM74096.1 hypothetical protein AGABI1DRAFT_123646 [Agaricus bisporus var. burnettii JB137-S8]
MSQTDHLSQHLKTTPKLIMSVLGTFQNILVFIAIMEDLTHDKTHKLSTEWVDFLARYVIMMWDSKDICIAARFQLVKLNDLLEFAMRDPPNLEVIKGKVNDYLSTPDLTAKKSRELVDKLKQLSEEIKQWKRKVWDDNDMQSYEDGTTNYPMMVKALNDLKERLPPELVDMKSAWQSDTLHPITDRLVQIQKAWLEVWYEAQLVTEEMKAAPDALTIKKLRLSIEKALSDYKPLGAACESYERELGGNLYPEYKEIIERGK